MGGSGTLTGVTLDVTDRHLAEERLRESEAFAHRVLGATTDCVAVVDAEGQIAFLNEPGRCQKEIDDLSAVLGQPLEVLWPAEAVPVVRAAMAEARAGRPARFTAFGPTAKGAPRWRDVSFSSLPGANGEAPRLLAVARDVTAAKEAEAVLRENDARLRELAETLEDRVREEVAARETAQARLV
ncbi:PAS domain S-box protein, partial [Roseomonas nepalensis]